MNTLNIRKTTLGLALTTLGMLGLGTQVQAASFTVAPVTTDNQFRDKIKSGEFTELFVAEGRIGRPSADRQLGINDKIFYNEATNNFSGGSPVASAFRTWSNGASVNFSLSYDGSLVRYIVGNHVLESQAFSGPANAIYLRTFANLQSTNHQAATVSLTNLVLDGLAITDLISNSNTALGITNDLDYLKISGLTNSFTLTGSAMMSWSGTAPTNSHLAYQLKVGTEVPEPMTMVGMGLGLSGFIAARRRQKQN